MFRVCHYFLLLNFFFWNKFQVIVWLAQKIWAPLLFSVLPLKNVYYSCWPISSVCMYVWILAVLFSQQWMLIFALFCTWISLLSIQISNITASSACIGEATHSLGIISLISYNCCFKGSLSNLHFVPSLILSYSTLSNLDFSLFSAPRFDSPPSFWGVAQ